MNRDKSCIEPEGAFFVLLRGMRRFVRGHQAPDACAILDLIHAAISTFR